jgi:hypothetical protein
VGNGVSGPWTLDVKEVPMTLHPLVQLEWREDHALSMRSLIWIEQHADEGDRHPIVTAIAQLRAECPVPINEASTAVRPESVR